MDASESFTLSEADLHFARELNGETWKLLDTPHRSADDDERMLAAAYGSYYHWLSAGQEVHTQRGEYLLARVYLALGKPQEALMHAHRILDLTEEFREQMHDFDIAFAYEMFARSHAAAGNLERARRYREMAQQAGEAIADQEDRDIFLRDLKGGEWYGA